MNKFISTLLIAAFAVGTLFLAIKLSYEPTPRIEYGPAVIERAQELVECEFPESITVIVSVMNYYDDYDELNRDHLLLTGDEETVWGWSACEWQPKHNVAFCDVYTLMPKYVRNDPIMDTIGHEQTHGSCGDFHK